MTYSNKNAAFRRDKTNFFSQFSAQDDLSTQFQRVDARIQSIDYAYLLRNKQTIESEFSYIFNLLQKESKEDREVFWLYSYYCANLLETYYRAYAQFTKEAEYAQIKQGIKKQVLSENQTVSNDENFINTMKQSFDSGVRSLINTPFHAAKIRDEVAFINVCRLYWSFCRLTLVQAFTLAKDTHFIDKIDALFNTHTDVDKVVATFKAPNFILNYMSVGLFVARLLIDGGALLKHTFFPSKLEQGLENSCEITRMPYLIGPTRLDAYRCSYILVQENELSEPELYYIPKTGAEQKLKIKDKTKLQALLALKMKNQPSVRLQTAEIKTIITEQTDHKPELITACDRFKQELYKRHWNFINDAVWAGVNVITNFNHLFNISGPLAGALTAGFLGFDMGMLIYRLSLEKEIYLTKKAQYLEEIEEYHNPLRFKNLSAKERSARLAMLHKQLMAHEINWKTKESMFYFVMGGAALLALGFSASLILTSPMLVLAAFFVATMGTAIYLSAGAYTKYKEKSLYLEQAQLTGSKLLAAARKDYEAARNDFIFAMFKNSVIPMVLISTFAICWPAAVILTAVYMGYEVLHAYQQHNSGQEVRAIENALKM